MQLLLIGRRLGFGVVLFVLQVALANAQTSNADLSRLIEPERPIAKIEIHFQNGLTRPFENPDGNPSWPGIETINELVETINTSADGPPTIEITRASGLVRRVNLASTEDSASDLDNLLDTTTQPKSTSCTQEAELWSRELGSRPLDSKRSKRVVLVFDENGRVCFKSSQRITQGDFIHVGVFGPKSQVQTLRLDVPTCSLESSDINILDTTAGLELQAAKAEEYVLQTFPPVECFDDEIMVQVRRADRTLAWEETLRQYKRYRGTWQIGVLWTDLDDADFSTIDLGAGPVIRSDIDDSTGPQYVASLVVYGFPHYLHGIGGDSRYPGRDIVNENNFSDRLGLFLAFGIEDPDDTLGVGISFELATGINLTATQLYRRIDVLDGLSVGDPFTGMTVPTQRTWENDFVFGISIDGRYLTKFFGGSQ